MATDDNRDRPAAASDFYLLDEELTDEERAIRDRVRAFAEHEVLPIINDYWERAEFPFELVPKLAELGIAGSTIEGYGCPGMSRAAAGIVAARGGARRRERQHLLRRALGSGDGSDRAARQRGAEAALAAADGPARAIGAFALTEPDHGSDSVSLETEARRDGDEYVLNGAKRWIGNASFADVVIVWARDEEGEVGGFVVEKGRPGLRRLEPVITGKIGKRAVWQAEITLTRRARPRGEQARGCATRSRTSTRVLTDPWRRRVGVRGPRGRRRTRWRCATPASANSSASRSRASSWCRRKLATMVAEITAMQLDLLPARRAADAATR